MGFRKKEQVIVELENFGEVVASTKEEVTVRVGNQIYRLKPEKVRKVVPDQPADVVAQEIELFGKDESFVGAQEKKEGCGGSLL